MKKLSVMWKGLAVAAISGLPALSVVAGADETRSVFGPNVEFGVIPVPIPQFGVVPDANGNTIYNYNYTQNSQTNQLHNNPNYNGYGYQWPTPPPYYGTPPVYSYARPGYSFPISPDRERDGYHSPQITVLPSVGYYTPYPNNGYPQAICPTCHFSPCRCVSVAYPYPTYPNGYYSQAGGYYPNGYYPNGYYSNDTRTTYGGITVGGGSFNVTIGGSRTTTQSSGSTTYYNGYSGRR